jgi:hypothetical protein
VVKLPFKIKICSIDFQKTHFAGEVEFHEKKFPFSINPSVENRLIRIPFDVIGVQNQISLVRISGINGIYSEDHLLVEKNSSSFDIHSFPIFDEISKKYNMLDTIEVFFK